MRRASNIILNALGIQVWTAAGRMSRFIFWGIRRKKGRFSKKAPPIPSGVKPVISQRITMRRSGLKKSRLQRRAGGMICLRLPIRHGGKRLPAPLGICGLEWRR